MSSSTYNPYRIRIKELKNNLKYKNECIYLFHQTVNFWINIIFISKVLFNLFLIFSL